MLIFHTLIRLIIFGIFVIYLFATMKLKLVIKALLTFHKDYVIILIIREKYRTGIFPSYKKIFKHIYLYKISKLNIVKGNIFISFLTSCVQKRQISRSIYERKIKTIFQYDISRNMASYIDQYNFRSKFFFHFFLNSIRNIFRIALF